MLPEPWCKFVEPREDLREGRPVDARKKDLGC